MPAPTLLASLEEFEKRHGPADDQVEPLLEDATALILEELASSEVEWTTDDQVDPPRIVVAICIQVAYRAWVNPDALSSARLGAVARTYRGGSDADVLWLAKNEARMLRKAAGTSAVQSVALETPYSGDPGTSSLDFWPL